MYLILTYAEKITDAEALDLIKLLLYAYVDSLTER